MAIEPQHDANWIPSRTIMALVLFSAVAGFFLLTEHTAHVFGALPFLLVFGCLLMHLFMHGGHGSHAQSQDEQHQPGES